MGATLVLALSIATSAFPGGAAQTLVDVTIQNPAFHDFEDGPQGWTANPGPGPSRPAPTATWEHGTPTIGPGGAASGTKAWATHLNANYTASECAGLMTPAIDLTGATTASIAYKHWRHFEASTATSTAFDGGLIMVTADNGATFTRITATGYSATNPPGTTVRTCWDGAPTTIRGYAGPPGTAIPPPVYATDSANLDAFAGQTIRVVFAFGSDSSVHRSGWFIDDVAVTIDGSTTVQDFEADNGGYTTVGTKPVTTAVPLGWSHGVPTTGPGSPTAMWATNPNGNPGPNECHWVESGPIDLGPLPAEAGAVGRATLSWLQWFRSSTSQAGVVQIGTSSGYTNLVPNGGYKTSTPTSSLDACLGHSSSGSGAFSGSVDPIGGPMTEFEADISEYLGQTITVRFLFASTSTTPTLPGWYVDDVNVEVALTVNAPSADDLPIPGGGSNAPGWTSGGPKSTWAFGVTTSNPAGQTTYKTNLNGNHDINECSFIDSPPVPGALLAGSPMLTFEHWHRIPGTAVNVPWAAGIVLVSVDGGATWTHLNMSDHQRPVYITPSYTEVHDDCLVNFGSDNTKWAYGKDSNTVAGNVGGWYTSGADLSALAGAPTVQVRFAYASDGTFAYEGWAIRSVTLGGVKLL